MKLDIKPELVALSISLRSPVNFAEVWQRGYRIPSTKANVKVSVTFLKQFSILPPSYLQKEESAAKRNFTGTGVFSITCFK